MSSAFLTDRDLARRYRSMHSSVSHAVASGVVATSCVRSSPRNAARESDSVGAGVEDRLRSLESILAMVGNAISVSVADDRANCEAFVNSASVRCCFEWQKDFSWATGG